jgi:hypothetical protein
LGTGINPLKELYQWHILAIEILKSGERYGADSDRQESGDASRDVVAELGLERGARLEWSVDKKHGRLIGKIQPSRAQALARLREIGRKRPTTGSDLGSSGCTSGRDVRQSVAPYHPAGFASHGSRQCSGKSHKLWHSQTEAQGLRTRKY